MQRQVMIVVPVYNDWPSYTKLVEALDAVAGELPDWRIDLLAVDDGSSDDFRKSALAGTKPAHLASSRVVELVCNLGHQRAIAVGMVTALERFEQDALIVMDADGEEDPAYVKEMLAAHVDDPERVITAERGQRSEGLVFRSFYQIYKGLFRALTGQSISFGNFGLLPRTQAKRLIHRPETWSNLAASIIRSRVPTKSVWTKRAVRYQGQSKMNFMSLILHGLGAMSVYSDVLFVRLLLSSVGLALLALCGIIAVVGIRIGTELAIPGWASTMVAALAIMLVQSIAVSFGGIFIVLQSRSTPSIIPSAVAPQYLATVHELHRR